MLASFGAILALVTLIFGGIVLTLTSQGRAWLGRLFLRVALNLLRISPRLMGSHPIATRRLHNASSEVAWALQAIPSRPMRHRRSPAARLS